MRSSNSYRFIIVIIVMAIFVAGEIYLFSLLPAMPGGASAGQPGIVDFISGMFSKPISLVFVGDIMMGRDVKAKVLGMGNGDYVFPFLKIASTTRAADLTIGNLEGALSNKGLNGSSSSSIRMDPVRGREGSQRASTSNGMDPNAIQGLTFAGFDVLSLATGHSGDLGNPALEDTISNIESAGILPIGAGFTFQQAYAPAIFNIRGTKLAFLGFSDFVILTPTNTTSGIAGTKSDDMAHAIQNARRNANLVFVYLDFETVRSASSTARQEELAHEVIDDGADIVVGVHPNVPEPIEKYKNKPIVYNLGNFVSDQNFSSSTVGGGLLDVIIKNKKIESVHLEQLHINSDFQPEPVPS